MNPFKMETFSKIHIPQALKGQFKNLPLYVMNVRVKLTCLVCSALASLANA